MIPGTANATVAREKVTFKQLQRHGAKLSVEFKHTQPSAKWYIRLMAPNRLSILIFGVRVVRVPDEDGWVRSQLAVSVKWTRARSHCSVIKTNAALTILTRRMK